MRSFHASCFVLATLAASGCGPTSLLDEDAAPRLAAEEFDAIVDRVGRRTDRIVGASGEAMLGDDGVPHRWARLDPEEPVRVRGAYVIEDATQVWVVTYETDGRTEPWTGTTTDRAIEHGQGHHHGAETITFALRGGDLVVLSYELVDDDETGESIRKRFARHGECAKPCPRLRGFETVDARLEVRGPAISISELTP